MAELNEGLLTKVLDHVRADLRRFNMDLFGVQKGSKAANMESGMDISCHVKNEWPACNTQACLAGWTVLLSTPRRKWGTLFKKNGTMYLNTSFKAQQLLGLESYEATELFNATGATPKRSLQIVLRRLRELRRDRKENKTIREAEEAEE